jgi:putative transcriptional regulator
MENGIKRIRLCLGMTQQAFADMLGCSQGNVGHYELRDQMVPPEVAKKLITEAAKRGSRVTYEDIYGEVTEPVVRVKILSRVPSTRREVLEANERKRRHAED